MLQVGISDVDPARVGLEIANINPTSRPARGNLLLRASQSINKMQFWPLDQVDPPGQLISTLPELNNSGPCAQ